MRYVLAIVLPPFAILGCRKPFQFVVNFFFWIVSLGLWLSGIVMFVLLPVLGTAGFFVWLLCTVHALVVCGSRDRDRQMDRLVNAITASRQPQAPGHV